MRTMRTGGLSALLASEVSVSHLLLSRVPELLLLLLLMPLLTSMSGPLLMMVSTLNSELLVEGARALVSMVMPTGSLELLLLLLSASLALQLPLLLLLLKAGTMALTMSTALFKLLLLLLLSVAESVHLLLLLLSALVSGRSLGLLLL